MTSENVTIESEYVVTWEMIEWETLDTVDPNKFAGSDVSITAPEPVIIAEFSDQGKANEILGLWMEIDSPDGKAPNTARALRKVIRKRGMLMDQEAWTRHAHILEHAVRSIGNV